LSGLLTLLVKDKFVKPTKVEKVQKIKVPLPGTLKKAISILVLIQLTNIPDALLLLRLHDIGFSTNGVVLSYMLFSAVTVIAAFPAGYVADKLSPRIVYAIGLLAFAIAYATLGITNNHSVAIVALVMYGLFPALTDGVGKAWIAGLSEDHESGRAQGVYQASMNFAVLAAGIWGGALWSSGATQWPLVVAAIGAAIGSLALAAIHLRRVRP
jgi:MFS family permease